MRATEFTQQRALRFFVDYLSGNPRGHAAPFRWEELLKALFLPVDIGYPEGTYSIINKLGEDNKGSYLLIPDQALLVEFLRDQGGISEELALEYLTRYTLEQMEGFD